MERLWQKSFWPMPKAGCLRADAMSVQLIAAEGQEGLLRKDGISENAGGRCSVCCTDTRRNKETALSRGLQPPRNGAVLPFAV